jgi:hypothetical protein
MDVAILAFDGMTALDAVGPAQVLAALRGVRLAGERVAQAIQLGIEYDPEPPYTGSPRTAPADVVDAARRALTRSAGG